MPFIFKPMDEASIYKFVSWRYDPPYDYYNLSDSPQEEDRIPQRNGHNHPVEITAR